MRSQDLCRSISRLWCWVGGRAGSQPGLDGHWRLRVCCLWYRNVLTAQTQLLVAHVPEQCLCNTLFTDGRRYRCRCSVWFSYETTKWNCTVTLGYFVRASATCLGEGLFNRIMVRRLCYFHLYGRVHTSDRPMKFWSHSRMYVVRYRLKYLDWFGYLRASFPPLRYVRWIAVHQSLCLLTQFVWRKLFVRWKFVNRTWGSH